MELALSHGNMDFDSLSAQYALTRLYPSCRMVLGYPLTGNVRSYLALNRSFLPIAQIKYLDMSKVTRFFLVDCQHLERLDQAVKQHVVDPHDSKRLIRPITIFDHHQIDDESLFKIATPDSVYAAVGAATTILVDQIIKAGIALTPFDATLLAIGIFEDTGCLTYSGTTAMDAHCISHLIDCGADLSVVREYIRPQLEPGQIGLFERLLSQVEIIEAGGHRFALASCREDIYTEGLATLTRQLLELNNVDGALTVAYMRDRIHIVGRCDPRALDLRLLMRRFGGDGHPGAASAVVKSADLAAIIAQVIAEIKKLAVAQPCAADLMETRVRTVLPDISMDEAGRIMLRYGEGGLVVASGDSVVGVISRRDIDQSTHHRLGHAKVSGFMSKPVISVKPDTTFNEMHQTMVREDIGRLPVLDPSGKLLGLVTRKNVLTALFGKAYTGDLSIGTTNGGDAVDTAEPVETRAAKNSSPKNLGQKVRALAPSTVWLAEEIGRAAHDAGMTAYAVGGFVRDLLLGRATSDLDFVIEGSAIQLAQALAARYPDRFMLQATHERFQTANLTMSTEAFGPAPDGRAFRDVDLSTARLEIYEKPAALPEVEPSKLEHDLLRRDFTINALAISLDPEQFGSLIDLFDGQGDLDRKLIRILHPFSFIEDPTRIVRAARFAGRLGFKLEAKTAEQARRAMAMGIFDDLGGVRIKEELRMTLAAPTRIKSLDILGALSGKLSYLDSQLYFCQSTKKAVRRAERLLDRVDNLFPEEDNWVVYLGALLSELPLARVPAVLERLQLTNKQKEIIESGLELHRDMPLELRHMKRSEIYDLMHGKNPAALAIAAAVAVVGSDLRRTIKLYMEELAAIKLDITGADLLSLGYPAGPALGDVLRLVLDARLDLKVVSRDEQLSFVTSALKN